MPRVAVAIALSPIATLLGAWAGQYVFPQSALGHAVVVIDGVTYGAGARAPVPLIVFLFPTKLSIPLALATYGVVICFGAPFAAWMKRRGAFTWWTAALLGGVLGAIAMAVVFVFRPLIADLLGTTALPYAAFIGAATAFWYWLVAYAQDSNAG